MNRLSSNRITFSAMMAAVSMLLLFLSSLFATQRLALCAFAGLPVAATAIRFGRRQALLSYLASGLLSLVLFPLKAPGILFLVLFGIYPVLKSLFESPGVPVFATWVFKLVYFSLSIALILFLALRLGLFNSEDIEIFGVFLSLGSVMLPAAVAAVIILFAYDFSLSWLIGFYMRRLEK